jgi:hypothetical protein
MGFHRINEGEVVSDAGYRIRIGHSRVTHFERGMAVSLDVEHMADGVLVIYGVPKEAGLDAPTRARILRSVEDALSFLGCRFEIPT